MRALLFLFALLLCAPALAASETQIVVPSRDIARGEVIAPSDLSYLAVAADKLSGGAVTGFDSLAGREARRYLRAGEPVRPSDVRMPVLVTKGSTVTMTFHAPGITLTGTGKAMSEGGQGELVTVLNPVSYRQVTCIVTGPGQVEAGPSQPLAQNLTERVAIAQPTVKE
jgi:flagella basal body P-ring formation protein FlgA